ncbi:DNA (cytosine-5-)-methyltransferase [Campylobacter ureolyticus]|uniref:DNA (cytosine-5-)-methyltransferase n=1 Tax=Campylobacter ureolyticus TaxID=827 RepID=UPI001FC87616|nr:DNA (cytosine-5-)-methyltransferase [Campylobacter ureolyticus]MCZ6104695.1 DNA (cytosine-5-)-methyltransferase [Campylobacter ureolyticus]MCZ6157309.1 DNA (cytosine-5-)-methyltransferase [Campylobacter ureolyticus]GKH59947.1 cytosine-specific methyltransferase [Campylobacter ureolyticus]
MTFFDFCSGIGGGRLGLELVGLKNVGFSEIDKSAILTYKSFFDVKKEENLGDIKKLEAEILPKFELLIAGFPCQSFSIVGKREGFLNEKNGEIIFYLAKILETKKPKYFILENVKGLISLNQGKNLNEILNLLDESGYNVEYEVLNSLNFGLAHSRERVYFIGIRKDLKYKFNFKNLKNYKKTSNLKDFLTFNKNQIFDESSPNYETFNRYLNNKYNKSHINLDEILTKNFTVIDTRQSDLRIYENKTPTIRRDRQGLFYVYNKKMYRLSGLEALNLQGFGKIKNLEKKIKNLKNSDLLKQSGNAMSVNVIEKIAKEIYG